jgi:fructoselysine-6-P-deglycase FrlB-like protein
MTAVCRLDVEAQARALLEFDRAPVSLGLYPLLRDRYDRIILTGTGAAHFAALPNGRRLMSRGKETSWIDTGRLLENAGLVTPDSLLIATSRSGRCPELIALIGTFSRSTRPAAIVAITDNPGSQLAMVADCELLLRSQWSGSPKGFLNALAAHDYIAAMILNEDNDDVTSTACVVAETTCPRVLDEVAARVAVNPNSQVSYIGFGGHAATSLYAALLTKESTGVFTESYAGEQFPQDHLRRADEDLTAILFGGSDASADTNAEAKQLTEDLAAAGATVIVVGDTNTATSTAARIRSPKGALSTQMAHGVVIADHFVSALAARMPRSVTS